MNISYNEDIEASKGTIDGKTRYTLIRDNQCFSCVVSPDGGGSVTSNIIEDYNDAEFDSAVDGIEAVYLSMACAGVDIHDPPHANAFFEAIEAAANNT